MKKRKLKPFVKPVLYGIVFSTLIVTVISLNTKRDNLLDNNIYVNGSIITKYVPTISETKTDEVIVKPFTSEKVNVYKKFYDNDSSEEDRKNSIINYNNTYVQNTGTLFTSEEKFDVVSILPGTVIDVKDDETLGKVITIKHQNNIISTYEGIDNVLVKKDSVVAQGDTIGTSGKLKIENNLENALLIEITKDNKLVNPELYFGKKINEI